MSTALAKQAASKQAGPKQAGPSDQSKRPSLRQLAAGAKADRNRAIDAYRAIAMIAVAVGHWMAMHVATVSYTHLTLPTICSV